MEKKRYIEFVKMSDPLGRFKVVASEFEYLAVGEKVLDPYPYFHDVDGFEVKITQGEEVFKNWRDE